MLSKRENYLIAAKGGKPEWVPSFLDDANVFAPEFMIPNPDTNLDIYGVKWTMTPSGPMVDPNYIAMTDISQWRDIVQFPNLDEMNWEQIAADYFASEQYDPDKVNICMANSVGIFLIPINMMGWEEGLCTLCEEPEEIEAFVSELTDFFCKEIYYLGKYFKPDIIFSGDDIAATGGPLISLDTYNNMYRKHFVKIAEAIHETGALAEFHCCGSVGFFTDEILADGYDILQLCVPNKDFIADKERLGNKLVVTGGWARHGEGGMPGASEEVVRQSVRDAIDTFGKDGALIFWDGGIIGDSEDSKNKLAWVMDELHIYGGEIYKA